MIFGSSLQLVALFLGTLTALLRPLADNRCALIWIPALPTHVELTVGNVYDIAELPGSANALYVAGSRGLFRLEADGASVSQIPIVRPGEPSSALNPSVRSVATWVDGRLVLGMNAGFVLASDDGGLTWGQGPVLDSTITGRGGLPVQAVAQSRLVRPVRNVQGVAYARLERLSLYGLAGIARTEDGGRSWHLVSTEQPVTTFDVDPDDPTILVLGHERSLRRSDDGGVTFADFGEVPLPAEADVETRIGSLVLGRGDWSLVVGTSDGRVLRRRDAASAWDEIARSPDNQGIERLSASERPDSPLIVVTSGGRAWRLVN